MEAIANLLTVQDIASKLKVTPQYVRTLIREEKLTATRIGSQWVVDPNDLSEYLSNYDVRIEPDDHPRRTDNVPEIIALSFFSGAMGLDIGSVTIGVALSDALKMIANAYTVIRYQTEGDEVIQQIVDIIVENEVDEIVIGMPYHMNKDESEGCLRSKRFKEAIEKKIKVKISFMDERLSNVSAQKSLIDFDLSRKKRKKIVDKIAATIILQNYLDARK